MQWGMQKAIALCIPQGMVRNNQYMIEEVL